MQGTAPHRFQVGRFLFVCKWSGNEVLVSELWVISTFDLV